MNEVINILMPTLITAIGAILSYLGVRIKKLYEEKVNTDEKRKVVNTCVKAVEQIYKDLHGEEKLNKAKENIIEILNNKGLTINELELDMMIEEVVNGLKKEGNE